MSSSTSRRKKATPKLRRAEQLRRFRREQPKRARADARRYREGHREEIAAYKKDWRARKRDHLRGCERAYREKHGEKHSKLTRRAWGLMRNPEEYIAQALGIRLRPYQVGPLGRILESIEQHLGDTFVLIFPRQSGKDELLIDLMLYLADLYSVVPVTMAVVHPTLDPQGEAAELRFDEAARANLLTQGKWRGGKEHTRLLGRMKVRFLSGGKDANVSGATASLLLVINEAQDISPEVYAHNFEPMAASTNATRIVVGTAWTSRTLLAQERRLAEQAEKQDGRRRVFTVGAEEVSRHAAWYEAHVRAAVEKHGRQHPMIRTQYFNEELDAQGGMFDARRRALIFAEGSASTAMPSAQGDLGVHVFCIDVAGQDEAGSEIPLSHRAQAEGLLARELGREGLGNPGRDATTLSIVRVDLEALETLQAPVFRVVRREQWAGASHVHVYGQLSALAERWRPLHIVVDATGVGEGLWSMLERGFRGRVIPVKFTAQKKSEAGYRFLSLIEAGRFRDECWKNEATAVTREMADEQYEGCVSEILTGPQKTMRWGVPDGKRNPRGELVHDDIVMADALITEVDQMEWRKSSPTLMVQGRDPLEEMSRFRER